MSLALVAIGWLGCQVASAQEAPHAKPAPAAEAFTVSKATSAIVIDGVLDEKAWAGATVIPVAFEYQPGDNATPPVRTDCLVTFDRENLYIAFRAFDPRPSEIRAHLMDRDSMDTFIQDDHVTVLLDTFNDERRAYQFRVNPLGVQADAVNSEVDQVEDWSWDAIWRSAGRVNGDGFVVEIAIPFRELRFPGGTNALTFGLSVERSYPRSVRHRIASHPTDRDRGCGFCQFNKVTGFQGLASGRNVEIDPTVTGHRTDRRDPAPDGAMANGKAMGDVGVTARWRMAAGTTLTGTVNPDFSQVEADVAQLDVNTRFALFYPEKRPFFLEGLDFFSTPEQAVFTRTVADPSGGLKVVGKQGGNSFGVFVTRDRINNLILPSNQESEYSSEDQGVTGKQSAFGVLYTGREGSPYFNRVFGPDAQFRIGRSETVSVQFLHAETQYSPAVAAGYGQSATAFGGNSVRASYDHFARSWFWGAGYIDRDKGFRADSGFVPRVDLRQGSAYLQHRFWGGANSWFSAIDVALNASRATDHSGTLTNQSVAAAAAYQGPMQSQLQVTVERDKELFAGTMYDETVVSTAATLKPSGALALQVSSTAGDTVDYTNRQPATVIRIGPSVEWKVGARLNLLLTHSLERLTVRSGWLYTANLSQFHAVYHFNRRTFLRAILQYTDISRDPARYIDPIDARSTRLFGQYLFSYKLNPQTVLLAGYSDNYNGATGAPLAQQDRTFFVKMGYAWLL
jgi:hypothetical protein